ncbi:Protein of unknown function (DUF1353) [Opitutaceae bacterium TAV1]|nr:Protein of unknown function (DUF1353) [Opitutaceae bacterium TAV1]
MMTAAKFPLPLHTETLLEEERTLRLLAPFAFESSLLGTITVEADFHTDLASIPRIFWRIFPPAGKYTAAAIIHDWLYWNQSTRYNDTADVRIRREQADEVFIEAMCEIGVGWLTRHTIYRAVRLGGGTAWAGNYKSRTGYPYPKKHSPLHPDFYRNRHIKR